MLKGVGMACVLVGAVALGVQCVRRRQLEQAQLRQFFTAFYGMERELRCRSPDLGELLEQASRQTGGAVGQFFRGCQAALCQLDAHAFDTVWAEQLTKTSFQLNPNAREAIRTVGTVLGQSPKAGDSFISGQSVELTISGGSTMVPDLAGRSHEEAAALLKESSLTEGTPVYVEVTDASQVGQVLAQMPAVGTMAVLDASVTLTVGIESEPYQGEVSLDLPQADHDRVLRVTLELDGEERVEYEGTVDAAGGNVLIPLSATVEGEAPCRIYLDGELYLEQTVALR